MKILVVEDEKKIASFIKKGLESEGYTVTLCYDGVTGLELANNGEFGLLILDWMLPKKDGMAVLSELRAAGNHISVLLLTAKDQTEDIVSGLDAGADDYLAKPFEFTELQARVRALKRRSEQDKGADIHYSDLRLDPVNHKVWRGQAEIVLTAKEYSLLAYFVRNAGIAVSRSEIAKNCWEEPVETFSNIVDVYINYLRKKIDRPSHTKLIHTVRGTGYILKERE